MKLYRVHYYEPTDGSQGYGWASSLRRARWLLRDFHTHNRVSREEQKVQQEGAIKAIEVTLTKTGVLALLNEFASYPDNG